LLLAVASCTRPQPAPPAPPHYVLEPSWQSGQAWFYPHERFDWQATGLAAVAGDDHPPLTTDGERFDQDAMAAGLQEVQLPAIAEVTDLETGRRITVRVNDRAPAQPGRIIALTRRAALLLGIPDGGTAQVRVRLDPAASQALADSLRDPAAGAPAVAAPRGAVQASELPPPPGARQAGRIRSAPDAAVAPRAQQDAPLVPPLRLPEAVLQGPVEPGAMVIRGSVFARYDYAARQAAALAGAGAQVERTRTGRTETFQMRAGPFPTVAAADAALDQARSRGVTDARIVVEQ
jgi:rare lipoprotein A